MSEAATTPDVPDREHVVQALNPYTLEPNYHYMVQCEVRPCGSPTATPVQTFVPMTFIKREAYMLIFRMLGGTDIVLDADHAANWGLVRRFIDERTSPGS